MPIFSSQRGTTGIIGRGYRTPYLYRQILTTGYVAGGYKDSVPWRNVVKFNMSADTSSSLGDLLQETCNYNSGAHNRDIAFTWGGGTGNAISTTSTSCFNMRNDTTYAKTTAMNTPVTIADAATAQEELTRAWIAGGTGNGSVVRFNLVTETASTGFAQSVLQNNGVGSAAHQTDTQAFFWADDTTSAILTFATETFSTNAAGKPGNHSQQKGKTSKIGFGWAGNEGSYNGGNSFRKWNQVTNTQVSTMSKPIGNSGEENFVMGQAHNWMLGMYDTGQNNRAWKWTFATDTGFEGGASMQPSAPGIAGRSSGYGFWRD